MAVCYVCNETKLEGKNKANEHIILNAIGGKLDSEYLICKKCADEFNDIDTELANQVNWIGSFSAIERDRKENPSVKAIWKETGEMIYLERGIKPALSKKPIIEDDYIRAKDRTQLKEILEGLQRKKKPDLNVQEIFDSAVARQTHLSLDIEESIGNEKVFRSVCKMAVSFFIYNGGNREVIAHLIPYLVTGGEDERYIWFYYPDESTTPSQSSDGSDLPLTHTLFLKGDPDEGILYCYIEIFAIYKYIVLLSDCYEKERLQQLYVFDVKTRKSIEKDITIDISREDILYQVKNRPEE